MKRARKRPKKISLRDKGLHQDAKRYLDLLLHLHDETDPRRGRKSEADKLNLARHAFHLWWRLYGRLMMWAQAQITGYHILRDSPEWVDRLAELRGEEIYPEHHEVELLGLLYPLNPPSEAQDIVFNLGEKLENVEGGLTDESLRRIIDEMHLSVDANSSYWRFPLGRALRAANYGESDEFFQPSKKKARGQPYTLAYYRALAVAHVYYLQGKGLKKYVALTDVAEAIAVK